MIERLNVSLFLLIEQLKPSYVQSEKDHYPLLRCMGDIFGIGMTVRIKTYLEVFSVLRNLLKISHQLLCHFLTIFNDLSICFHNISFQVNTDRRASPQVLPPGTASKACDENDITIKHIVDRCSVLLPALSAKKSYKKSVLARYSVQRRTQKPDH